MNINVTPKRLIVIAASSITLSVLILAAGVFLGASIKNTPLSGRPMKLLADSATRGKNVSLATGLIDDRNEALFILDHLNGNLQCWVLNSRTNEVGGIYRTNVLEAMPGVKIGGELDFVMTTGFFDFNNRGNQRPANSIAYVAEGKSGIVVGFGFQFDKAAIQRGLIQEGVLEVVCQGPIRELQLREQ